jgi:lipopolysaccharide biosynthesis glycosyltransferase
MIRVFIGYDSNEVVAWHTLCHSIMRHTKQPTQFIPLMRSQLEGIYDRPKQGKESTEFSMTRFLVPYLSDYEGWSIFMDCDMLVTRDFKELWDLRDDKYAVQCVKHDYSPTTTRKFLNQEQSVYEKKNWSSVMLFNNAKCKALTPEYVNTATGLELHQFKWLESEDLIGDIPAEWNFLVGEEHMFEEGVPGNIHYTLGGPYFDDHGDVDYADLWFEEQKKMNHVTQIKTEYTEDMIKDSKK